MASATLTRPEGADHPDVVIGVDTHKALSSSASASKRYSREFSCSSSLRRLASVDYGLRPTSSTCRRRDAANGGRWQQILQSSKYIGNCLALVEQLLGTAQLADDLLGVVAFAFYGASPGQVWPIGKLS